MRVTGVPQQLADRVRATGFGTAVALSESGTLVAPSPVSAVSRLIIHGATGRVAVGSETRAYQAPRFSPDGRRIAVGIAEGDAEDLWLLDRVTGAASRLTRGGSGSSTLQDWTPDGRALVYLRDDKLWIARVDGSEEPRRLLTIEGRVTGASVTPDGRSVVLTRRISASGDAVDREDLVRVPIAGDGAVATLFSSRSSGGSMRPGEPRVSPDGKWVAFQERNERQVHVRSMDGTIGVQVSDTGGARAVWSGDGRRLFYRSSDGFVAADLQFTPTLAVLQRQRVTQFAPSDAVYDISADGKSFLVVADLEPAPPVLVTLNWAAEVRRQLRTAAASRTR
jgi:Tol biopolymer transport system component